MMLQKPKKKVTTKKASRRGRGRVDESGSCCLVESDCPPKKRNRMLPQIYNKGGAAFKAYFKRCCPEVLPSEVLCLQGPT